MQIGSRSRHFFQRGRLTSFSTHIQHENVLDRWNKLKKDIPRTNPNEILSIWQKSLQNGEVLYDIWKSMKIHYPQEITPIVLESTCLAFWKERNLKAINEIARNFDLSKVQPQVSDVVVRAFCIQNKIREAEAIVSNQKNTNMTLQSRLLFPYVAQNRVLEVIDMIQYFRNQPSPFWTVQGCRNVMSALNQLGEIDQMFEFLQLMSHHGVSPDAYIIAHLLDTCIDMGYKDETRNLLENFDALDIPTHPILIHARLRACLLFNQYDLIPQYIHDLKTFPAHPNTPRVLHHVFHECIDVNEIDAAGAAWTSSTLTEFLAVLQQKPSAFRIILPFQDNLTSYDDWLTVIQAASEANEHEYVYELFLNCPFPVGATMLQSVATSLQKDDSQLNSEIQTKLIVKCKEFVQNRTMPLYSAARDALLSIYTSLHEPRLILELLKSSPLQVWKVNHVLTGMKAARDLNSDEELRLIYTNGNRFKDNRIDEAYNGHLLVLAEPLPCTSMNQIIAVLKRKQLERAKAMLIQLHPSAATWRKHLKRMIHVGAWSFALEGSVILQRHSIAMELFTKRITQEAKWIPSVQDLEQIQNAYQAHSTARKQLIESLQVLAHRCTSKKYSFPAKTRASLIHLSLVVNSPSIAAQFLPAKWEDWGMQQLHDIMEQAKQTECLADTFQHVPDAFKYKKSILQQYVLDLLQCQQIPWPELNHVADQLVELRAWKPVGNHVISALLDNQQYGDLLRLRNNISSDTLESSSSWKNLLETLNPNL